MWVEVLHKYLAEIGVAYYLFECFSNTLLFYSTVFSATIILENLIISFAVFAYPKKGSPFAL